MQAGKAGRAGYAPDRPKDCAYCYFWKKKKQACSRKECFYLLPRENVPGEGTVQKGDCRGCPYGRAFPCVGYCLQKTLMEMRKTGAGK